MRLARIAAFHREPFVGDGLRVPESRASPIGWRFSTPDRLESLRRTCGTSSGGAETARRAGSRGRSRSTLRSTVSTDSGAARVEAALVPGQGPGRSDRRSRPEGRRRPRLQPDRADDDGGLFRPLHRRHDRQARAIADAIVEKLGPPLSVEGLADGELDPDGLRRRRLPRLPGGGAPVLRARASLGRRARMRPAASPAVVLAAARRGRRE